MTARWFHTLQAAAVAGVLGAYAWVFLAVPIELNMGFVQKIMYLRLPTVIVT